jgi:hypothetical protein
VVDMVLPIKPLIVGWNWPQPANLGSVGVNGVKLHTLVLKLCCDCIDIDIEIFTEEVTDFRVFVVACQNRSCNFVACVNVDVSAWTAE